ncbi:MAG: glycosyltransferase family 2 protein, partial [Tannerellaceae bacterium]
VYFIDADFALGESYNYGLHDFIFLEPYWDSKIAGGFYGGKTSLFKQLCCSFYDEVKFLVKNKLPLPKNLDEHYLNLFYHQEKDKIHLIRMSENRNTLAIYDNEDLDLLIQNKGNRQFIHLFKANQRANKTTITDVHGVERECIVNVAQEYIFDNYSYDLGRLMYIDDDTYRVFWTSSPESRDVLKIKESKIYRQPIDNSTIYKSPCISVVMPMYNPNITYLKECVDSILSQTFKDFELIIVDDGSTDLSGVEFIQTYNDSRIRLIQNEHDYINSLNTGIREAKGVYIARMDADDIMLLERLQVQFDYMESHLNVDVCGSWIECFGSYAGVCKNKAEHVEIVFDLITNNTLFHPTVIMRAASLQSRIASLYEVDFIYAEDYRLWTQLVKDNLLFSNISVVLLKYRTHKDQITHKQNNEMYQASCQIKLNYILYIVDMLVLNNPSIDSFLDNLIDSLNKDIININQFLSVVKVLNV